MASPLFNSQKIFDSIDANGNYFTEGVLYVPSYSPITQRIHFEGEVGDWTLFHGYPDMEWSFEGIISGTTLAQFTTQIGNIQSAIDACMAGSNTTYYTLVNSYGYVYDDAQVRNLQMEPPHVWQWNNAGTQTSGYLTKVKVTGIISSNQHVGGTS